MIVPFFQHNTNATDEHSLTFIIYGSARVSIVYPNMTKISVSNGTYYFTGYVAVLAETLHGYNLYVNGAKYYPFYSKIFNSSATLIINTTPIYYTLTINLKSNGNAELHFLNGTVKELTSSISLNLLNDTYVWLTSETPFMVDKNTMITNYFGENITINTTWNVFFNPLTPKGYLNVTVKIINQGVVNMTVYNGTTFLTLITLNHTESFLVPKGYFVTFYSYENNFTINNREALYIYNKGYTYYSYGTVKHDIIIIIIFPTKTTTNTTASTATMSTSTSVINTTTNITTLTTTPMTTDITGVKPITSLTTTQYKHVERNNLFDYIIITIVVIIIVIYLLIRIRR